MVVGSVELHALPDAVGLLAEYADAYPEVAAEAWEPYRALYPDLFAGESWRVPCKCYLVRSGGVTVLVDTGVGPPGLWGWTAEQEGDLPDALDRLGVAPSAVDIVFLTHLHIDHVGWNTDLEGSAFFPRARYLAHRDSVAFASSQAERPHVRRCIAPLLDRFEDVNDEVEIAPGVTTFARPGHYQGHMALRLASKGLEAVLLADVAVHPALLDEPDWIYISDGDPAQSAETRRSLLPELLERRSRRLRPLSRKRDRPHAGAGRPRRVGGEVIQPRVGVGCVVRRGSELLLVRRRGAHGDGTWSSPGGNLDFGEEPALCAARESEEETGVEVGTPRFVGLTNDVFESENKRYVTLWFEAEHERGEAHARAEDELSEVAWFREDELPDPLFLPLRNFLDGRRIA